MKAREQHALDISNLLIGCGHISAFPRAFHKAGQRGQTELHMCIEKCIITLKLLSCNQNESEKKRGGGHEIKRYRKRDQVYNIFIFLHE